MYKYEDMCIYHLIWFIKHFITLLKICKQKINEAPACSGTYNDPERRTPAGAYYLYNKERNRVLRGTKLPDGTWPYETPVSYWLPFNKGIGLHDSSSWRSKWGGTIYMNNGSHGCINLPTNIAAQLYNNIEIN